MAALSRPPVLTEAIPVRALSAHLRRPRPRSATSAIRRLGPFPFGGSVGFNASSRSRGYARERKGRQSHDRCGPESEITLAEVSAALELIKNCRCAVGNETAPGD